VCVCVCVCMCVCVVKFSNKPQLFLAKIREANKVALLYDICAENVHLNCRKKNFFDFKVFQ
jgi:hypothetical protein